MVARQTRQQPIRASGPPEGEPRLVRGRRGTKSPYDFDVSKIPEGFSLEWKRESVLGEKDEAYALELRENHWTPVSPELAKKLGVLPRHGGLALMQRPTYLTDEARADDKQRSREAIYGREAEARATAHGAFEPHDGNRISKRFAPKGPEVPE